MATANIIQVTDADFETVIQASGLKLLSGFLLWAKDHL